MFNHLYATSRWKFLLLLVIITTASFDFYCFKSIFSAENLMVGDFETLERWIGRIILICGCEDQGWIHLSSIWWWQKGEESLHWRCNLKSLGDIAWFKGKFVYLSYILASGEVCDYLVLSYQLGEDCWDLYLSWYWQNMKDEGLKKIKWRMQKTRDLLYKEDISI